MSPFTFSSSMLKSMVVVIFLIIASRMALQSCLNHPISKVLIGVLLLVLFVCACVCVCACCVFLVLIYLGLVVDI